MVEGSQRVMREVQESQREMISHLFCYKYTLITHVYGILAKLLA